MIEVVTSTHIYMGECESVLSAFLIQYHFKPISFHPSISVSLVKTSEEMIYIILYFQALCDLGRFEDADSEFDTSIKFEPENANTLVQRA